MVKKNLRVARDPATARRPSRSEADSHPSALTQNRLLEAQATIERDYLRLRELETRYRFLLQSSADPILIVTVDGLRVVDANAAACERVGLKEDALVGATLGALLQDKSTAALRISLQEALNGAAIAPLNVKFLHGRAVLATMALFRQDGAAVLLVRFDRMQSARHVGDLEGMDPRLSAYVLGAPDAMVLTNRAGLILLANEAFVELIQVTTEKQIRGASLGRWLGRTSVDLGVLLTNLKQRGSLKLFATQLRAEHGTTTDVEISAAQVGEGDTAFLGFTIRDVGRRLPATTMGRTDIAKSVDQMTELVGRVPMKDIVGNTSGLIEQMCIRAALELTRDNRAAAAELLGLSRQSFYVKMRRYKMLEAGAEDAP